MPDFDPEEPQSAAPLELVMPFVTVQSKGGPHDDQSYVAGYEMGALDAVLTITADIATTIMRTVHAENAAQLDLIAMKHGYWVHVDDDTTEGWLQVTLARVQTDA